MARATSNVQRGYPFLSGQGIPAVGLYHSAPIRLCLEQQAGPLGSSPGLVQDTLLTKCVLEPSELSLGALSRLVNGQEEGGQDCTLLKSRA